MKLKNYISIAFLLFSTPKTDEATKKNETTTTLVSKTTQINKKLTFLSYLTPKAEEELTTNTLRQKGIKTTNINNDEFDIIGNKKIRTTTTLKKNETTTAHNNITTNKTSNNELTNNQSATTTNQLTGIFEALARFCRDFWAVDDSFGNGMASSRGPNVVMGVLMDPKKNLFNIASYSTTLYKNVMVDGIESSCQYLEHLTLKVDLGGYYDIFLVMYQSDCTIIVSNGTGSLCRLSLYVGSDKFESKCSVEKNWTKCSMIVFPVRVFTLGLSLKDKGKMKNRKFSLNLCEVYVTGTFHPPDYNPYSGKEENSHTFEKGVAVGLSLIGLIIFLVVKLKESEFEDRNRSQMTLSVMVMMDTLAKMKEDVMTKQEKLKTMKKAERKEETTLLNKRLQLLKEETASNVTKGRYF